MTKRAVLFANTDWYLYNFRRSLAGALKQCGIEPLALSPPGEYGPKLVESGLRWRAVEMDRRSLNPIRELNLVIGLFQLFRRERPVVVHNFTIKCAVYGSIAARLTGVPRINAVAGMGYVFSSDDWSARLLRPLVRLLMRLAFGGKNARLILQNPDDVALFEREGLIDRAHVRLIKGSGVDCERFHPAGARSAGPIRVLLASRLLRDKGVVEYVSAARRLRGRAVFLLAGDPDPGNPAAISAADIRRWHDEGLVEWLGHVDDMPALMQSVDIAALPSYREGLPKGLIEAAACALALVTTDVPGCREVVTHEVDGLLVPARDAAALAGAIERLLDAPGLRARLGTAARAKALAEFDEKIVIAQTLAVYRELLPGTPNI